MPENALLQQPARSSVRQRVNQLLDFDQPSLARDTLLGFTAGPASTNAIGAARLGQAAVQAAPEAAQGIRAYHGSPHGFEQFDLSKIGTGEGAQSYGHGLYFAQTEDVARHYRDIVPANTGVRSGDGNMYEVQLNVEPNRLLDWDAPLARQPQPVRDAIAPHMEQYHREVAQSYHAPQDGWGDLAVAEAPPSRSDLYNQMTGQRFYKELVRQTGSAAEASRLLREAGIPGSQHWDGNSRFAAYGSRNYVAFDDSIVEILRKYGIAGLMAGGATAVGIQGEQ